MADRCRTVVDLPNEITESILQCIPTEELLTLQSVNSRWRYVILQTPSLQRRLCLGTYHSAHYSCLQQEWTQTHMSYNDTISTALPWFQPHVDSHQLFMMFPASSEGAFHFFEHFVSRHAINKTPQDTPLCSCTFPDDSCESAGTYQNQVYWCSQQLTCPPTHVVTFHQNQWTSHSKIGEPNTIPQSIVHEAGITVGQSAHCVLRILRKGYDPGRSHLERPFCDLIFRQSCWSIWKPSNTTKEQQWFERYKQDLEKKDPFRD